MAASQPSPVSIYSLSRRQSSVRTSHTLPFPSPCTCQGGVYGKSTDFYQESTNPTRLHKANSGAQSGKVVKIVLCFCLSGLFLTVSLCSLPTSTCICLPSAGLMIFATTHQSSGLEKENSKNTSSLFLWLCVIVANRLLKMNIYLYVCMYSI